MTEDSAYNAQVSVIGSILIEPKLFPEAASQLRAEDFTYAATQIIFQAMTGIFREAKPMDVITVADRLRSLYGDGEFGTLRKFLVDCMEVTPTTANFSRYVEIVRSEGLLHRLRELGSSLAEVKSADDAAGLIDQINEATILRQARERRSLRGMFESFAKRHAPGSAEPTDYLPWGLPCLTERLLVPKGKYGIIGGYSSDGKTAFALFTALAQSREKRVGFYSYETDADAAEDRVLATACQINMGRIKRNQLTAQEWDRYSGGAELTERNLDIIAASGMTAADIRADAMCHHYDVIYIDYVQLVTPDRSAKYFSRYEAVSQISMDLQRLAKETGIIVIPLSQLTRPQPTRQGKISPPTINSLKESGQLEQDADFVLLLYKKDPTDKKSPRVLALAKNKDGETDRWDVDFDGATQTFRQRAASVDDIVTAKAEFSTGETAARARRRLVKAAADAGKNVALCLNCAEKMEATFSVIRLPESRMENVPCALCGNNLFGGYYMLSKYTEGNQAQMQLPTGKGEIEENGGDKRK